MDKVCQQGGSGGGTQLPLNGSAVGGDADEQVGRGWGWHWHNTMLAAYRTAAHMNGRRDNLLCTQQVHGVAHTGNVSDRIQGSHLMKVNVP